MKYFLLLSLFCLQLFAQDAPPNEPPFVSSDADAEASLEKELSEFENSESSMPVDSSKSSVDSSNGLMVETTENPAPKALIESNLSSRPDLKSEPLFVKPPGPKQGGVLKVPHPNAAKGLIKIDKDGSYQYKVRLRPKSQSSSFRFGFMTPPKISGTSASYKDYYGDKNVNSFAIEYEWQPFQGFGRLGFNIGSGFASVKGKGFFKKSGSQAEETYTLYTIPLSAFLTYRFEFMRRQWVVPFVNGGGSLYGLAEVRDDNKINSAMGSAVGGGGGLLFSISAIDNRAAFILDREYGIADLYFSLEARAMQGVSKQIDFTHQSVNGGITVDF